MGKRKGNSNRASTGAKRRSESLPTTDPPKKTKRSHGTSKIVIAQTIARRNAVIVERGKNNVFEIEVEGVQNSGTGAVREDSGTSGLVRGETAFKKASKKGKINADIKGGSVKIDVSEDVGAKVYGYLAEDGGIIGGSQENVKFSMTVGKQRVQTPRRRKRIRAVGRRSATKMKDAKKKS